MVTSTFFLIVSFQVFTVSKKDFCKPDDNVTIVRLNVLMTSSDQHRPTIKDVARAAGVSSITVSRVAAGSASVKPATRERVLKKMRELDYQPNMAARSMRTRQTQTIGFLIPDLSNELFSAVARAAETVLSDAGYMLFIYSSERSPDREIAFLNQAAQRGMDGLILSLCDETHIGVRDTLKDLRIPMVIWDRDIDGLEVDTVYNEHARPMEEITQKLISLGHRRIALISASLKIRPGRERVRGFKLALDSETAKGVDGRVIVGPQSEAFGFEQLRALMSRDGKPTALIVGGNDIFHGVMKGAQSLGLRIPEDLSIVGTDDRLVSTLTTPPVTVIDRDMEAIGQSLATALLDRMTGRSVKTPNHVTLESEIVERHSVAQAPPKGSHQLDVTQKE